MNEQTKDLQFKYDQLKRTSDTRFLSATNDVNLSSTYESPFRNFLPSRSFKSPLNDRFSDLQRTPNDKNEFAENENSITTKSIKINLTGNDIGYKSRSCNEKYSSDSVSAALYWGNENKNSSTAQNNKNPEK